MADRLDPRLFCRLTVKDGAIFLENVLVGSVAFRFCSFEVISMSRHTSVYIPLCVGRGLEGT